MTTPVDAIAGLKDMSTSFTGAVKNMKFIADYVHILKTSPFLRIGIGLLLLIVVIFLLKGYASSKSQRPLPPGPPPLFLIKNLHQVPVSYSWRVFQKWHKMYGPIVSLQFGPQVMISISSYEVAHDLFEKRKETYDARPHVIIEEYLFKRLKFVTLSGAQDRKSVV